MTWLLLAIALLATPALSSSADFTGPVVSALDGDTIEHAFFCLQGTRIWQESHAH